ncbi:D-2-hydroxyacid dehydrogenase [Tetragenococcus halophilus]|uniref:D-2-hydroxyacid dehydrogenase n=1 Tax=Tetragenococcus halophilus TaxID=51669 RepID=UPI001F3D2194|nr:D-2-hydroxyacid dehydrogenase [Tetragenococcus halophilus]MCF1684761.1 D-2-hydroxyacid dehydrogenase [Tetragenococcus halophilus]
MTKIISFDVNEERMPFIKEWSKRNNVEVTTSSESLTLDNVDLVEGYDGVTIAQVGDFDSKIFPELKKRGIKQLAQRTAGFDNFDLEEATKNNILVSNAHSYSPESIAEFSLLLGLQLIRKSHLLDEKVAEQDFRWIPELRGRIIKDKTVAILGVGNIGLTVAKLYKAFGANVIGYDPYPKDNVSNILTYSSSIEEAVQQADIISIHMPAFKDNYHLFDEKMFQLMKNDAHLINAGRGSLVDTKALIKALNNNELASAALDVYENEAAYVPGDHREQVIEDEVLKQVLAHPKIDYYHHCAYYTDDSIKNMTWIALDATLEVIRKGDTKYRVN